MRATQQKRRLLGNPHWTGTAQATSPLDKDAADQEVRGFRIPNDTGGIVRRARTLDLAPPKQWKRNSPSFRGGHLATERQRSPEDGKIYARCMV